MKKILVLNFFPAFVPPASGGELRYFNIYNELSRHFDITLLSPTYSHHGCEIVRHSDRFREYRVPKENQIHDKLHREIEKEKIGLEYSALVCALSANFPNGYHTYYNKLYGGADIIIHDCPFMLGYDLYFGVDNKPRVHNSYNFESSLFKQIWTGEKAQKYLDFIGALEKWLIKESDLTFAITEEERLAFIRAFDVDGERIKLAPNGINPEEWRGLRNTYREGTGERRKAFFIGSGHPPNIAAVEFILNSLARECKEIDFIIAGSCCDKFKKIRVQNVELLGKIDDQTKANLFSRVDIALNPMFSGSGTNLKTLEFLSAGIPLLSTEVGARGLNLTEGTHFIAGDKKNFAERLRYVLLNPDVQKKVSSQGQRYINDKYSWTNITDSMAEAMHALADKQKRKTIFLLNDFEASKPSSGGEIRINRLYSKLSSHYTIVLLCLNSSGEIRQTWITDTFLEISIPKTDEHIQEETKSNSQSRVSTNDIVSSYMCVKNDLLKDIAVHCCEIADVIVSVHPYMIRLLEGLDNKPIIYESLNYEVALKKKILQNHPQYNRLIQEVEVVERTACERSLFIISVSDDDHKGLAGLINSHSKEIFTVNNGVDAPGHDFFTDDYPRVKDMFLGSPTVLFVGSGHMPNYEAVHFIIHDLAPAMKDFYFIIVGTVCDSFRNQVPKNVLLFGRLDSAYKDVLFRISDIAVNPMVSGSGSNLKLADYFAHKIPAVTTPFGARGYLLQDGREAIICELSEFKAQIEELWKDKKLQDELIANASDYVARELDWTVLAGKFNRILKENIFQKGKKRLLVVTYRFTDPPLGGAEVYLLNLLNELDKTGDFSIDVATLNIKDIFNQYHFSIRCTYDGVTQFPAETANVAVYKFIADILPDHIKYANAKKLFQRWMREFVDSSLRHLGKYRFPLLMGGWHFPEKIGKQFEIWSSNEALLYTRGVKLLSFKGYCLKKRELRLWADDKLIDKKIVHGTFEFTVNLNESKTVKLTTETIFVDGDPRPLGVRIYSIKYQQQDDLAELRLDYDYKNFLKEHYYEHYIDELIRVAGDRPDEFDELFQQTRGPHSQELERWLDSNIKGYDAVLGHSIPFATTILAAKYAKKHDKPLVLLPHFHIDDEFYHWKSYYSALATADVVMAAPDASKKLFYDKISVASRLFPGGAITKNEYNHIDSSDFKRVYASELPFFLVLGRKAAAKNYGAIIDAIKAANKDGKLCNLVMIGIDEDGLPVNRDDVLYLGAQPRNVVLGALKECRCLITMSQSESFGIVILEAWMQKKPVIVSEKCVAFAELVQHDVNGLLANEENLHEKISSLLQNDSIAHQMGENGFNKVTRQYTWEAIAAQFNELLCGAVEAHKRNEVSLDSQEKFARRDYE
jgi:glycosyltransferase involved in cell wall biosynthesis